MNLNSVYPILYLDALMVKVKDQGHIVNKAVYLAIGVTIDGLKEVLGLWIEKTEGAKFWLQVITELKNRGVKDIYTKRVQFIHQPTIWSFIKPQQQSHFLLQPISQAQVQ